MQRLCILNRSSSCHVQAIDEHDHHVATKHGGFNGCDRSIDELRFFFVVFFAQVQEPEEHWWRHHEDDPRTFTELRDHEYNNHGQAEGKREAIHEEANFPLAFALAPVPRRHASTSNGEPGEHPKGIERHEPVHAGVERHHQKNRNRGQNNDAVGKGETVATLAELAWQVMVTGDK